MPYEYINGQVNGNTADVNVVDLRSDTISHPTNEMREAMLNASVGDDVYGEDPTVEELVQKCTTLLGKEAGLFLPSGTMSNLAAIMAHCDRRGCELICGHLSHIFGCEQGGPSNVAAVHACALRNAEDGTFCLEELEEKIKTNPDIHEPYTALICVENTHNMCGGKVLPLEWLDNVGKIGKKHGVPIHMDGARLMNAAIASKIHPSRIARDMDSITICLSKGLAAPVGSVLMGSKSFIQRANRARKVLGGGMRQSGFMAAAGIVAIENMIDRLEVDHRHAYKVAKAINSMNSKLMRVDLGSVQSNILMVYIDKTKIKSHDFLYRLASAHATDSTKVSIKAASRDAGCVRFVFYWEITEDDVDVVIEKLRIMNDEYNNNMRIM